MHVNSWAADYDGSVLTLEQWASKVRSMPKLKIGSTYKDRDGNSVTITGRKRWGNSDSEIHYSNYYYSGSNGVDYSYCGMAEKRNFTSLDLSQTAPH